MVSYEVAPLSVRRDRGERAQRLRQRRGLLADQRQRHRLVDVEVQAHVQLVAILVTKESALLLGLEIDLAEQDGITAAAAQEGAQVAQELVGIEPRLRLDAGGLQEEGHGVDPEPRKPELQPKADDPGNLLTHGGVHDVEVGLVLVEAVQEVAARLSRPIPNCCPPGPGKTRSFGFSSGGSSRQT